MITTILHVHQQQPESIILHKETTTVSWSSILFLREFFSPSLPLSRGLNNAKGTNKTKSPPTLKLLILYTLREYTAPSICSNVHNLT